MDLTNRPKTKPSNLSMSSENYTILDLSTRPKTNPSYLSPPPLPGYHQGLPKMPPKRLSKFPLPPSKRLLEFPLPPSKRFLEFPPQIEPPPPGIFPPPPPGIFSPPPPGIFSPENCLMIREMQRQFQLQSQHAPKQHQKVCSFSNNSTTTTTSSTSTAINLTNASESMINLKNNLIEIFPSITIFEDEEDVKFLSRDNFKNHSAQAYPFIQFKFDNSDYISYYGIESSSDTAKKNEERDRLYRLLKATKLLDEKTGNENVSWTKLDDVFKKLPVSFRKKKTTTAIKMNREKHREEHADTRLGYRFDNMFAVKRFFTFGERMVNSGEVHIIQTCEVPILYNELKMEHYRNKRKISQSSTTTTSTNVYNEKFDGLFDPTDQKYYNTYVLNPHTVYMIPSNTIYILITMQKTLFSLDRVDNNKFQKMRTENWRWKVLDIYPPQAHKQLQIEIPSSVNPVVCKNVKRKKLLDHEKKWVYNDVLNPPQIFTQPRQIIVEGEDQEIQFNTEPTYFYFEPNNQFYYQQQEQQNVLMSGIENNDDILINPPVICCYSSTPPPQQQQEEQNLVMSGIENNDEILINPPVIGCSSTPPPPQQQQEEQNVVMSGIEKIDEMLISPLVISCSSTPPPPPQQQEQQNVVMSNCKNDDEMLINPLVISCSSTPPPPQEQQNVVMSNCKNDDEMLINPLVISCSSTPPPPPQQQQEQQNVVMSNCENDDEMLINPLVICCSPPPQQQQDVVMSNNENDGEILTTPPSTPLKESSSLSDETTKFSTPPPQSDKNGLMFDFDSIDYSSPLPEEQKEQFNETLLELSKLADDNISLNPLSCDDNNHSENNPIPTISFKDMSFTEPSENFITECNKLLEDLNNFAKECLEL